MNLKIFQSILFSSLRPWKQGSFSDKDYSQYLRTTGFASQNNSISEFQTAINNIFPKDNFTKDDDFDIYELNTNQERQRVNDPLVIIDLPKAHNPKCRFYFYLITNEVTRLSDLLLQFYTGPASQTEKTYVINNLTPQLKQLIKESTKELQSNSQDADIVFILKVLQLSLVRFLLEVEHLFQEIIKSPLTTDEELYFDLLNDEIPRETLYRISDSFPSLNFTSEVHEKTTPIPSKKLSFKFKGDKAILLSIIKQLNFKVDMLNNAKTSPEQFVEVLTCNDLSSVLPSIYFHCETKQVRYIIDKLQFMFSELYLKRIGDSKLFFSADEKIITYSNLSSSSSKHLAAKNHTVIDDFFSSH